MPEYKVEGPDVKKTLKFAKTAPISFAYNPGKTSAEDYLALHKLVPAEKLGRDAKKEGVGTKAACGTASLEGKDLTLTCEIALPNLAKKLKKYLKSQKYPLNIVVLDSDGTLLEEDIEQLPDDEDDTDTDTNEGTADTKVARDAAPETDPAEQPQIDPAELVARINSARVAIAEAPQAVQSKLTEAVDQIITQMKTKEFEGAAARLIRLEAALARLAQGTADTAAADLNAEKWAASQAEYVQDVAQAQQRGIGNIAKIEALWALAQAKAGQLDYTTALKALPPLRALLNQAQAVEAPAEDDGPAEDLEAVWRATLAELTPMLADAATQFPKAIERLQAAWEKAITAAEGGKYKSALEIAQRIRTALATLAGQAQQEQAQTDTATEQSLVAAFDIFRDLRDQARTALADVPADHDQAAGFQTTLDQLDTISLEQGFAAEPTVLQAQAQSLRDAVTTYLETQREAKSSLLASLEAGAVVPAGANDTYTGVIAALLARTKPLLTAEIPSKANFNAAQALLNDIAAKVSEAAEFAALYAQVIGEHDAAIQALSTVPVDHTELAVIYATTTKVLNDLEVAVSPDELRTLSATCRLALVDISALKDRLTAQKTELLEKLATAADAPDGAFPAEAKKLADVLGEGRAALTEAFPTAAHFELAEEKLVALGTQAAAISARLVEATKLKAALDVARTQIDGLPGDLAVMANLNEDHLRLTTVLNDQTYAGLYDTEITEAAGFTARVDAAKTAQREAKIAISALLDRTAVPPVGFLPAEKLPLDALLVQGKAELTDEVPSAAKIAAAQAKLDEMETARGKIRTRLKMAGFGLTSGGEEERYALWAVETFEKANKGLEITPEVIAEKTAAANAAASAFATLYTQQTPAATQEETDAAYKTYTDAKFSADTALGGKYLTEALTPGGVLSKTGPIEMDEATRLKLIVGLVEAPVLTTSVLDGCRTTGHVADIAPRIGEFRGRCFGMYADPAYGERHAALLLEQGCYQGAGYLDGALAYIDKGWPFDDAKLSGKTGDTWVTAGTRRGAAVADALLAIEGDPYDLSDPAKNAEFTKTLDHLKFGDSSVSQPTASHTAHLEKTMVFLETDEAKEMVKTCSKPEGKGADLVLALLKQLHADDSTWVAPVPLTPAMTQQALLVAMFNPIEQGSVGSCFATAGLITLREQDPERTMAIYKQALEKGTFTPLKQVGDLLDPPAIPLITQHTKGDNPITRAIEYTAATAGSALTRSSRNVDKDRQAENAMTDATVISNLQGVLGSGVDWLTRRQALEDAIRARITFEYLATAELASVSSDGSSSFGCYVALVDGVSIHDKDFAAGKAKFVDAVFKIGMDLHGSEMSDDIEEALFKAVFADDSFTNCFVFAPAGGEKTAIWQLSPGGFPQDVDRVLLDATSETTQEVAALADPLSVTEGARTLEVVTGLMQAFDGETGKLSLFTSGQHIFNGLTEDPSQDPIRGKTDQEIASFFTTMGNKVTDLDLPVEQAAKIYDDALAQAIKSVPSAHEGIAKAAMESKRPNAAGKPGDVNAAIKAGQKEIWDSVAAALTTSEIDTWVAGPGSKHSSATAPEKKAAYEKELRKTPSADSVRTTMAAALPMPEPVILADTNWGGGTSHSYFVIAPDPASGEPIMWIKTEPPGSMTPAGRDWVDRTWQKTTPVPPPPPPPPNTPPPPPPNGGTP